jgi:putative transcriptional regulator
MKKTPENVTSGKHDWSRLDAMTQAQKRIAAMNDPDNPPLSEADMKRMKRTARAKIIRRALGLSQEESAVRRRKSGY